MCDVLVIAKVLGFCSQSVTVFTARSEMLRFNYVELTTTMDVRIVAAHMFQRNMLTLKQLQSVQNLKQCAVEAAEVLVNIMLL